MFEKGDTIYLPPDAAALKIIDLFKNGPLSFPISEKKEVIKRFITPWMEKYEVTLSPRLKVDITTPEPQPRVLLSELNESNLMIRPQFSYNDIVVDYSEEKTHVEAANDAIQIIQRNGPEEKKAL